MHLLKSQVRGGGVLLTNGHHKRYIPLSGLSVILAPWGGLKGLLYSFNGEYCYNVSEMFWLWYILALRVSRAPSMESLLRYSLGPRCDPVRACLWPLSTEDRQG